MGIGSIIGGLFGKKPSTNVDLAKKIDLHKENLTVVLSKKGLLDTKVRVGKAIDKSGSMGLQYEDGTIQDTMERLFAVALKMDDNGLLDVWSFNNGAKRHVEAGMHNIEGYVDANINYGGGTSYAPVIRNIVKKYIAEDPSDLPSLVFFITDGDNDDHSETEQAMIDASQYPIFWQFVGIGDASFNFLRRLDDMEGRVIDNANFFELNDLSHISDDELYDRILGEFPSWLKEAKRVGILK